jgi:hypothetical protein
MRVQIKALKYWKTEHGEEGCQDAYRLDESKGLFAVADGAGTSLFPAIWARILVERFIAVPLMSDHPFEVEWWLRPALEIYKTRIPAMSQLRDWSIQQKALSQSSDSTLAAVRIVASDATSARAQLLVFGDSCVIIGNRQTRNIRSFALHDPDQFAQPPVCLPSLLRVFNRDFHTGHTQEETLGPDDIVVIASDAVSKWIIDGGGGRFTDNEEASKQWQSFQTVCACTVEDWPTFIEECRASKEMINDDCTALILDLQADAAGAGVSLGTTPTQVEPVVQQRLADFEKARREDNKELVAIYYGDGKDLKDRLPADVTGAEIEKAREVAHALKEVMRAFRQYQQMPDAGRKMQPVWDRYRSDLLDEKCAEGIRETLKRNGVYLTPPPPPPAPLIPLPPRPANDTTPNDYGQWADSAAPTVYARPASGGHALPAQKPQDTTAALRTENEQLKKEAAFLKEYSASYTSNNDDTLLATEADLKQIWPTYQFSPDQQAKVAEVKGRRQAMEGLRIALRSGNIQKIAAAASNLPEAMGVRLTPVELRCIDLACRLKAAFDGDDDTAILTLNEELLHPENRSLFRFTDPEFRRIELAQRRQGALRNLRAALQAGRLRQIVRNYDPILDGSSQLTQEERELLQLAREFILAFDADDDFALAEAYEKIKQSSYYTHDQLAFTPGEQKRSEEAEQKVDAWRTLMKEIVAQVKGQTITLGRVRKVGIIRKAINEYWIERYQQDLLSITDAASWHEKKGEILQLQEYIAFPALAANALDELANDLLIQKELVESGWKTAFQDTHHVRNEAQAQSASFRTDMVADYAAFLRDNRLVDDDVLDFCELYVRAQSFKPFYERQQQSKGQIIKRIPGLGKPKQFDDWLESQRKEVKYSRDGFKQTALWIADKLGWKEEQETG